MDKNNEIWFGKDGKSAPSRKTILVDLKQEGTPAKTIWNFENVGHRGSFLLKKRLMKDKSGKNKLAGMMNHEDASFF